MPSTSSSLSPVAPASLIDSRTAAWRLFTTLGLVILGNSSMYVVSVVLPAVCGGYVWAWHCGGDLGWNLLNLCIVGGLYWRVRRRGAAPIRV